MSFHPSIPGHLNTEIVLLSTLRQRAVDQHRHQPFIRRIDQVLRLSRMVWNITTDENTSPKRLRILLDKMSTALITAASISAQIIQLYHFLPLQISLVGIYARLYTLSQHMISVLDHEIERDQPVIVKESPIIMNDLADVGTLVKRSRTAEKQPSEAIVTPTKRPTSPIKTEVMTPAQRDLPKLDEDTVSETRKRPPLKDDPPKRKKKKQDAMDNIFSLL